MPQLVTGGRVRVSRRGTAADGHPPPLGARPRGRPACFRAVPLGPAGVSRLLLVQILAAGVGDI